MNLGKRIMKKVKSYEKSWKIIKIDVFNKQLHGIHDSTGHGVHDIIIYNIVSHYFQFLFCFLYITHFIGIHE